MYEFVMTRTMIFKSRIKTDKLYLDLDLHCVTFAAIISVMNAINPSKAPPAAT